MTTVFETIEVDLIDFESFSELLDYIVDLNEVEEEPDIIVNLSFSIGSNILSITKVRQVEVSDEVTLDNIIDETDHEFSAN